jgi:hypothetical protein
MDHLLCEDCPIYLLARLNVQALKAESREYLERGMMAVEETTEDAEQERTRIAAKIASMVLKIAKNNDSVIETIERKIALAESTCLGGVATHAHPATSFHCMGFDSETVNAIISSSNYLLDDDPAT